MDEMQNSKEILQWHPAFFASLQIELAEEADNLDFESEHQLGTKPKAIDALIVKKQSERPVRKNIGKIFRKYNIVEYKSPEDTMSVDDFYKVYGYACFYKADVVRTDSVPIEEITISLVCSRYPQALMKHLKEHNYDVCKDDFSSGIYYVKDSRIPVQIIVTKELPEEENFWLGNLTNNLRERQTAEKLLEEYGKHKNNNLYKSVMNIIVNANKEKFTEVKRMCEALEELMKDELEAMRTRGLEEGRAAGFAEGCAEGRVKGLAEGHAEGRAEGRAEATRETMQLVIELYRKLNIPFEEIQVNIEEKFGLTKEQAESFVKQYRMK